MRTSACVSGRHSPGFRLPLGDGPDAGAHQAHHRMADRLAHAPHLAVAALVDGDAAERGAHERHLGRRGQAVVELDALAQPAHAPRRRRALHLDQVLLLHAEAGVGEAMGQVAVVGEQQQALGVGVEAADREDRGARAAPGRSPSAGPAGRRRW